MKRKRKQMLSLIFVLIMAVSCPTQGTVAYASAENSTKSMITESEEVDDTIETEATEVIGVTKENEVSAGNDTSDESEVSKGSGASDESTVPKGSETPDESTVPEGSKVPDESAASEKSETPDESTVPEGSETPDESTVPEESKVPEEGAVPEKNKIPDESTVPEEKETPDESTVPGGSKVSEESAVSEENVTLEEIPQTFRASASANLGEKVNVTQITAKEDAFVGSYKGEWGNDQNTSFGTKNFLRAAYSNDSSGVLGTGGGLDNKVIYLKFDTSSFGQESYEKAELQMTLSGVRSDAARAQTVCILVGEAGNSEWSEATLTWNNKPAVITEEAKLAKGRFTTGNTVNNDPANITSPDGASVIVDITSFIDHAKQEGKETLTLAVNIGNDNKTMTEADANRIFFVSKEGAAALGASDMAPVLLLTGTTTPDDDPETVAYTSFHPGKEWLDMEGNVIQAHGGGILWDDNTKKYYWYGENKSESNLGEGYVQAIGVSCYSSADLYNWKYEGMALPVFNNPAFLGNDYTDDTPLYLAESDTNYIAAKSEGKSVARYDTLEKYTGSENIASFNELYQGVSAAEKKKLYDIFNWNEVVERPKVIYNEKTQKYVMWFHKDGDGAGKYAEAQTAVAVSDSPAGPFRLAKSFRPNGNMSRDMTLFKDEDGIAYLIHSSENNQVLYITELNEDYTDVTGRYSKNYVYGTGEPWAREAPAIFKYDGYYYLVSSGCTGWDANPMGYSVTQDITAGLSKTGGNGPFQFVNNAKLPNPCAGTGAGTSFGGQSTFVVPVEGKDGCFIYMGDVWNKNDLKTSKYQWLPIQVSSEDHTLTIEWEDEWTLDELEKLNKWKALNDAVKAVEKLYEAEYSEDSWAPVESAYNSAKALDENTSNDQILSAAKAINMAIEGLVKIKYQSKNYALTGKAVTADSAETKNAKNQAENAIDGKNNTFWHTDWDSTTYPLPHHITIDLGESVSNLCELIYMPRQDKDTNGIITEYQILVSSADKGLKELTDDDFTLIRGGTWDADKTEKSAVFFTDSGVRFVRLRALAGEGGYASAAEIRLNVTAESDTNELKAAVEEAEKIAADKYTTHSVTLLRHVLKTAKTIIEDQSGTVTQEQIDRTKELLTAVKKALVIKDVDKDRYDSVPVGQAWLDIEGDPIQAHGGGFLQQTDTDGKPVYYWVGEDKAHNTSNFNGISLYSSKDLLNWKYRGTILQPDILEAGLSNNKIERPKLVYNKETKKYVLWGHWEDESGYSSSQICVATCDTVDGEYEFLGHWRPGADAAHHNWRVTSEGAQYDDGKTIGSYRDEKTWGTGSRDFTVYVDGDDAYLISAEDHETMRIYKLNHSFTDVDEEAMESYQLFNGARREAPAVVKSGEYYFMISSAQSGWYPNQTRYSYTKDIADPEGWAVIDPKSQTKMPAGYLGNNTTFYSQPTNIMTITGSEGNSYVYMGDRWNSKELGASTYVWLPLTLEGADTEIPTMTMEYQSGWSLNTETGKVVVSDNLLISEGKKATSDAQESSSEALKLEKANDGNYINENTVGGNHEYFKPVTAAGGDTAQVPFTYTLDLDGIYDLSRVDLSFNCHNGSECYYQYTVDTSLNAEKWNVAIDANDNKTVGFQSHVLEGIQGRYVRLSVNKVVNDHNGSAAGWAAGLVEVQVYGKNGTVQAKENGGLTAQVFKLEKARAANNVLLKWEPDSNAVEYRIFRAESEEKLASAEPICTLSKSVNNYEDYGLDKGVTYYYQVRGYLNEKIIYKTSVTEVKTYAKLQDGMYVTYGWADSTKEGIYSAATDSVNAFDDEAEAASEYSYAITADNSNRAVIKQTNNKTGSVIENILGTDNSITPEAYPELADCKFESTRVYTHPKTGKVVIWAHYEKSSDYATGALVCFTLIPGDPSSLTYSGLIHPNETEARDYTIYIEGDSAYLIAAGNKKGESANNTMYIHKLNENWDGIDESGGTVAALFENQYREAPALVKVDGYYYLFTSQAAGWLPSQGAYSCAKELSGPWSELRVPADGSSFSSQQNGLLKLESEDDSSYLLNGYRWWKSENTGGRTLMPVQFNKGYATAEFFETLYWSGSVLIPERSGKVLSSGKTATFTSGGKTVDAPETVDGDYTTKTTGANSWPADWTVDLGETGNLSGIEISWYMIKGSEAYYPFKVYGSNNGNEWTELLDKSGIPDKVSAADYGFVNEKLSGEYRYVKLEIISSRPHNNPNNSWYTPQLWEVKVLGYTEDDLEKIEQENKEPDKEEPDKPGEQDPEEPDKPGEKVPDTPDESGKEVSDDSNESGEKDPDVPDESGEKASDTLNASGGKITNAPNVSGGKVPDIQDVPGEEDNMGAEGGKINNSSSGNVKKSKAENMEKNNSADADTVPSPDLDVPRGKVSNAPDVTGGEDDRGQDGGDCETGSSGTEVILVYSLLILLSSVAILVYIRKKRQKMK